MKRHKSSKEDLEYARQWYKANRMYKRTYERFYRRCINPKHSLSEHVDASTTIDELIRDRQEQIKKGRWLDERNGKVYEGIK